MGVTAKEFTIAKNDGVQSYGNIVQLVESPKNAGVLYAGTDDGKVHMTKDGKTWTDITSRFKGVPKNAYVSRLTASAHDVNVVYATFDNHRADDMGTFIYASVDGGNNFRSIGEGIPKGHTVTSMAEDPKNPTVLYSGSEFGLFVSPDRGGKWTRVKSNLPTVPIHEIVIHPRDNDMIVATHGRSIWILDDITPLQQQAGGDEGRRVPVRHARRHAVQSRPTIAASSPTSRSSARTRPTAPRSVTTCRSRRPAWRCGFAMVPARRSVRSPAPICARLEARASTASTGTCAISRCRRLPASRRGVVVVAVGAAVLAVAATTAPTSCPAITVSR